MDVYVNSDESSSIRSTLAEPEVGQVTSDTYSVGEWVVVAYSKARTLSGIIRDYDHEIAEYCVSSVT